MADNGLDRPSDYRCVESPVSLLTVFLETAEASLVSCGGRGSALQHARRIFQPLSTGSCQSPEAIRLAIIRYVAVDGPLLLFL